MKAQDLPDPESPHPISALRSQVDSGDHAQKALWIAIGLQALYLAGLYLEISVLTSFPMILAQLLAPAVILVIAKTWRSAFKYSLLSSLVIPATMSVAYAVIAVLSKPGSKTLLDYIITIIKMSLTTWFIVLYVALPAIGMGVALRFLWIKLRTTSR